MKNLNCIICGKKISYNKYNNNRVKYCSDKCNDISRHNRINIPIKMGNYVLDKNELKLYINNKKVDKKRKFEYKCDSCGKLYITTLNYLKTKRFKWLCMSCSYKNVWKDTEYKERHRKSMIKLNNSEIRKKQLSDATKNTWKNNIEFRTKVLSILNSEKVKIKSIKNRKYRRIYKYGKSFRSTYEYRFATALNKLNIKWKYEPKFFRLTTYNNRIYFPDFYLPEYDIWIETKGYFTEDAKNKFNYFKSEYPEIKIKVFFNENIKLIEEGNINEIIK